jgi:serine/threonine protein kinase
MPESKMMHSIENDDKKEPDADACVPIEDWQTVAYPSCNSVHEIFSFTSQLTYLAEGGMSYVMSVQGYDATMAISSISHNASMEIINGLNNRSNLVQDNIILKGNQYRNDFSRWWLEGRKKDAIVQEHSQGNAFVASIHGYCGTAVLAPLSPEGDLYDYICSVREGGQEFSPLEKLKVAIHLASGLASVHDLKHHPNATYTASVAHDDVDISQYIYHDGIFQLNDFNSGIFVTRRNKDSMVDACFEQPVNAPYLCQAPEYMAYLIARTKTKKKTLKKFLTGKAFRFDHSQSDVFSLGTSMYLMLSNKWMWEEKKPVDSMVKLLEGKRPPLPAGNVTVLKNSSSADISASADHAIALQAIVEAIEMCWIHDPMERATARDVELHLRMKLQGLLGLPVHAKIPLEDLRVALPELLDGKDDYRRFMKVFV